MQVSFHPNSHNDDQKMALYEIRVGVFNDYMKPISSGPSLCLDNL